MKVLIPIVVLLLLLLSAVTWKAWNYRNNALKAMRKIELLSERFTKSDFYREDNERRLEERAFPDVVFMGASITRQWNPEGKLGDIDVAQRGVGGQWPSHYLIRFKADVIDLKPRAVVIKACSITFRPGVHMDGTRRAVLDMIDLAEQHGIQPILATSLPVRADGNTTYDGQGNKDKSGINGKMLPYNDWLRELARERGLVVMDFFAGMADDEGFLPRDLAMDDIHPNAAGHERMTEIAGEVLSKFFVMQGS
jgi:hypothetical protein